MTRLLTTSEFALALGVSESSIRRLADAGELQIHRTRGGHRRIPAPEAIRYIRATQASVQRPDLLGLHENSNQKVFSPKDSSNVREQMLRVLSEGHAKSVISLMQSLYASGMSIAEMCDGPIAYAMRIIGEAWPHDKKAIFVEHRAVVLCCRAMNQLRMAVAEPDSNAPRAVGGAMPGDRYFLPTVMASLVLYDFGFNETNLGPDLPLDVLSDCVIDEHPSLVWLAMSEPIRSRTQTIEIRRLVESAEQVDCHVVIGGKFAADAERELTASASELITFCSSMKSLTECATRLMREKNQ